MGANLIESFRIMGLGMLGIFAVACILMLVIVALKKIFPADPDKKEE